MAKALQTKLTREQKDILKGMRQEMFQDAEFYQDAECSTYTVMVSPACEGLSMQDSRYVRVASAIMGNTENKFRAKAGLYNVMNRMDSGEFITIRKPDLYDLLFAFGLDGIEPQPFAI